MKIQQFLNEFAFSEINNVYQQLKESSKFILKKAQYKDCPIQQNRSKYNTDDSPIVCSLCNERGHNWLTCLARQEHKKKQQTEVNEESKEYQELDETIHIDDIH
jgi:hypothetical protein